MSDRELEGNVAIVTGGSRGIGRAISEELALSGARIAVVARNGERAKAAAKELPGEGHGGYACDVAQSEQVAETLSAVEQDIGPVSILVNNAGITRDNILLRMKDEVGVLANALNVIKRHGINVEEITNTVFDGALAGCTKLRVSGRPSEACLQEISAFHEVLYVDVIQLPNLA